MRRSVIILAAGALALSLAGCSGPSDKEQAIQAAQRAIDAILAADAKAFCDNIIDRTRLEPHPKGTAGYDKCVSSLTPLMADYQQQYNDAGVKNVKIDDATIEGDKGTVSTDQMSGDFDKNAQAKPTQLVKVDGRWYVGLTEDFGS